MKKIIVFTDGSCECNGKIYATGGYGIYYPNKEYKNVSEPLLGKPVTNQRAELMAIYEALKTILGDKKNTYDEIIIYTDSEYSIKSLTEWSSNWIKRGWKNRKGQEVKNRDILEPLINLYNDHKLRIILRHIRSHTGKKDPISLGNEEADKLAVEGGRKGAFMHGRGKNKKEKKIIIDNIDITKIKKKKKLSKKKEKKIKI